MKTLLKLAFLVVAAVAFAAGRTPPRAKDPPAPRSSWTRRLMLGAGSLALVTGLSLLGYGTYQMTHEEPEHRPGANVAVLNFTDVGGTIYDRPVPATPTPSPSPTPPPPAPAPLRDSPYRIRMPKIGIDAAVVTYGLDSDNVPEVPYNGQEVAWYDFSAKPGTGSNAVFAGHVTWSGHAVFYDLDQMIAGDDIILEGTDGTKVYYKVSEIFLVDANDPNALSVMGPTGSDTITVITCGGDYFYVGGIAAYDYTHRLVVRAALTGIEPPPAAVGAEQAPAAGG
jgi:LPXTG-site transpeptidase (sortase) family protein